MTDGLPPGGGNNPHLDREIEAGKRADASSAFEEQGDSKRARLIESVIHAEYSRIPSLQRLAYNAVPNDQQVPPIMLPSIYPPWGSWRPPPILAQPGSGTDHLSQFGELTANFVRRMDRQRTTRQGQVLPPGTYVDTSWDSDQPTVIYQYDEAYGSRGSRNQGTMGIDQRCSIS